MNEMRPIRAKSGTNQEGTSAHNRRVMIDALRLNGQLSRADLARATKLTKQTVSNIIEDLERDGLVSVAHRRAQRPWPTLDALPAGAGRRIRHRPADRPACDTSDRGGSRRHRSGACPGKPATGRPGQWCQGHSRPDRTGPHRTCRHCRVRPRSGLSVSASPCRVHSALRPTMTTNG
jgi:DNA-binding transcriptional ArsR family regulator